jgi:hypothetical protein
LPGRLGTFRVPGWTDVAAGIICAELNGRRLKICVEAKQHSPGVCMGTSGDGRTTGLTTYAREKSLLPREGSRCGEGCQYTGARSTNPSRRARNCSDCSISGFCPGTSAQQRRWGGWHV